MRMGTSLLEVEFLRLQNKNAFYFIQMMNSFSAKACVNT